MNGGTRFQLRSLLCAALISGLTACGGGGSDKKDEPSATPSEAGASNTLTVESGDVSVTTGTYTLDTTYSDASSTVRYGDEVLELVWPEADGVDAGFVFSQKNPAKYIVMVSNDGNETQRIYACRSNAWAELEIPLIEQLAGGAVPVCAAGVTVDAATHHVTLTHLTLPGIRGLQQSIKVSANFSWVPSADADSQADASILKIESGSTLTSAGLWWVNGGNAGGTTINGVPLQQTSLETASPLLTVYSKPDNSGYIVWARANSTTGMKRYGCASATGWTTAQLQSLAPALGEVPPVCPASVAYDAASSSLVLNKAALPLLDADSNADIKLLLSVTVPLTTTSVSSGSSGGTAIAVAATPIP